MKNFCNKLCLKCNSEHVFCVTFPHYYHCTDCGCMWKEPENGKGTRIWKEGSHTSGGWFQSPHGTLTILMEQEL